MNIYFNTQCISQPQMFDDEARHYMVQDDQKPFYEQGLRQILHMIATPFPRVWHTLQDNREALHLPTLDYISKIVRLLTYSLLFT